VLGAMVSPGLYYERGLLHPFIDYDVPPPWLNTLVDPMDDEGNVPSARSPASARTSAGTTSTATWPDRRRARHLDA